MTAPAPAAAPAVDRWGNIITSPRGWYGQYTIRHWLGNRVVYVCGQPQQHVKQGMWRLDGRMDGSGQGYVCCSCFPIQAGLYGIVERR